jgi:hypothetical protein
MSAAVTVMRGWLVFLALFEVPPIYNALSTPPGAERQPAGFASNLQPFGAERRLWAFMLGLLVCSRVAAASGDVSSPNSLSARPCALSVCRR